VCKVFYLISRINIPLEKLQLSTCVKKQCVFFVELTLARYNSTKINVDVVDSTIYISRQTICDMQCHDDGTQLYHNGANHLGTCDAQLMQLNPIALGVCNFAMWVCYLA
jgi:hypothetical protein